MKFIKTLKIDINKNNYETIPSVEFDKNARFLHVYLLNNSVPFDLTGCSVKIYAIKADNTEIFNNCKIIDYKKGFVEIELTEQMNAATGNMECELKIYSADGVLTTKTFFINISKSIIRAASITSTTEYNALTDALNKVQGIDNKVDKVEVEEKFEEFGSQLEHTENKITSINISSFKLDTNTWADAYYLALESLKGDDGELIFAESCDIDRTLTIRKGLAIKGNSSRGVILTFIGTGNLFECKDNQWDKSITFCDLTMKGNATNNDYGSNATNNCIYIGNEDIQELINTPFVFINNCEINNFNIGIYLEGYGHHIEKTHIYRANRGISLVHPEQTTLLNNFVEYCDVGIEINPKHKSSRAGHMCIISGGAVQRCNIGMWARNFYQLRYQTYSELNKISDIILGEEDSTMYKYGVHGAIIDLFSSTKIMTSPSIQMFDTQDVEIHFSSDLNYPVNTPNIQANGRCKYITVYQEKEKVSSTLENAYDFQGESIKSSIVYKGHSKKYMSKESISTEYGEFAKFVGDYRGSRTTLAYHLYNSNLDIVSNSGSAGFRLINNINDIYELMAYFYPNGNFVINKGSINLSNGDFVTNKNGGGFWTKSPNGTTYKVYVGDDGLLKTQAQ